MCDMDDMDEDLTIKQLKSLTPTYGLEDEPELLERRFAKKYSTIILLH